MRRGYLLTRRISRFLPARISARADGGWSCRGAGKTVRLKHSSHHDTAVSQGRCHPPLGLSRGLPGARSATRMRYVSRVT